VKTFDVAVIGAGIVGAACADALAAEGHRVVVIDSRPPGTGTTAAGMGHLATMDDSPAQEALTTWSIRLWRELAPELPSGVEWSPGGAIWIAADEEELSVARDKAIAYASHGVAADLLDDRRLREAEPNLRPGLAGGLHVLDDTVIYPPVATGWLVDRARRNGAEVRIGSAAMRVSERSVDLANGERVDADWVVNAAGTSAIELLEAPLQGVAIRPRKGHLAITARYPGFCRHQLLELGYLKSAHGHAKSSVAFNLQPRKTGQMLIGSSRQFDAATDAVEHAMVSRMLTRAIEYVPGIRELAVIRTWTGYRAATDDGLPLVGPAPDHPKLLMAAGHEGLGITTSLATGRMIADIVAGRPSAIDRAPFAPGRGGRA